MLYLRSFIFNILFYIILILFVVVCLPLILLPAKYLIIVLQIWARTSNWLLRVIANIKIEIYGVENIPKGAALVAVKHQSFWETYALMAMLDYPAIILKKELGLIPLYGWYAKRCKMIIVNRKAHSKALRKLIVDSEIAFLDNRQIIIFPEGTRKSPYDTEIDYKPGIVALYSKLNVPCVPVALNSGLYWPRRSFLRYPGTIKIAFLPAINPGLSRQEFMSSLVTAIENKTKTLI